MDILFIVKEQIMFPLICFILALQIQIFKQTHHIQSRNFLTMLFSQTSTWSDYGAEASIKLTNFYKQPVEKVLWFSMTSCLVIAFTQARNNSYKMLSSKLNNK